MRPSVRVHAAVTPGRMRLDDRGGLTPGNLCEVPLKQYQGDQELGVEGDLQYDRQFRVSIHDQTCRCQWIHVPETV